MAKQFTIKDTVELTGDEHNPRKIKQDAAVGLSNSLNRFGDLSGIVFNEQTGELVCGHQRMAQVRQRWGDLPIEVLDSEAGLGRVVVDADHCFTVRVVSWLKAMQRAANVAANSQKISGQFTEELPLYLQEIEAEIEKESPNLLDELLLIDLMEKPSDGNDPDELTISESFQVIVQCKDEDHQRKVYEQLSSEGLPCKVLTL